MRFPRNAKIFRGQIDVAALASVFFLLLLFLIASTLLYVPGVPIQINAAAQSDATRKLIRISRQGEIIFENRTYTLGKTEELKAHMQSVAQLRTLVLRADTAAPRELVLVLRDIAKELRLAFETQNVPLELPDSNQVMATASPSLVVAVNLGGQFFFENQLVSRETLLQKLRNAVKTYKAPPSLVIMADKATESSVLIGISEIANEAGITQVLLGVRPRLYEQGRGREP